MKKPRTLIKYRQKRTTNKPKSNQNTQKSKLMSGFCLSIIRMPSVYCAVSTTSVQDLKQQRRPREVCVKTEMLCVCAATVAAEHLRCDHTGQHTQLLRQKSTLQVTLLYR